MTYQMITAAKITPEIRLSTPNSFFLCILIAELSSSQSIRFPRKRMRNAANINPVVIGIPNKKTFLPTFLERHIVVIPMLAEFFQINRIVCPVVGIISSAVLNKWFIFVTCISAEILQVIRLKVYQSIL